MTAPSAGRRDALTSDGSVELTELRLTPNTVFFTAAGMPVAYLTKFATAGFIADHHEIPASEAIAWLRAVANAIEAREDAR